VLVCGVLRLQLCLICCAVAHGDDVREQLILAAGAVVVRLMGHGCLLAVGSPPNLPYDNKHEQNPLLFLLMFDEDYLTSEQVAQALRVTPQTIRNWIKRGDIPAERYGHVFRIRREDFEAFAGTRPDSVPTTKARGDVWSREGGVLPRRRPRRTQSVWDAADPALPRKRP
jgi:excisionase family DNA binding protein